VGPVTLRITAGGGGNPATASTLSEDPGVTGPSGGFGQQADSVTIDKLHQNTWLTTAGTFTLPGFNLSFGNACY
jgi:hypothetical protein